MRTTGRKDTLKYFFKNRDDHKIDAQIDAVLNEMDKETPGGEKYNKLVVYLERLHEIKAKEGRRMPVSWDTIVTVGGNALVVLMIIAYEQKHVMTSKAKDYTIRPKL